MKPVSTINRLRGGGFGWLLATGLIALAALLPILAILWLAFFPADDLARAQSPSAHLLRYVLPPLIGNTLSLMAGVLVGTLALGAGTAWLVSSFRFAFRGLLAWGLILPLALPGYILAYVYADLLAYGGPAQEALRALMGWRDGQDYFFPEIRSLGGAIVVMSLALYPYTYIAAYGVFARRSASVIRAARTLGAGEWACFVRAVLPLARPALAAAAMLVLMECLNDIGVVEYFGVRTLTVGLYDIWLGRSDLASAIQIALVMLVFAFGLIMLERFSRREQRHDLKASAEDELPELSAFKQTVLALVCALPPLLGFFLPMGVLAWMAWGQTFGIEGGIENEIESGDFFNSLAPLGSYAWQSLVLGVSAALIVTSGGLFLSYALRITQNPLLRQLAGWASMGYALPGAVLGLGIILVFVRLNDVISPVASYFNLDWNYGLMTGYKILLFAYFVRFLAIPYGLIGGGFERITPTMDMAARTLGARLLALFGRVHLPLLRPAILGGLVLVFVEAMRDLPMTLLLRPFNFETLATHIYTIASVGLLEDGALAALLLGLIGLALAFLWARALGGAERQGAFL